MKKKQVQDINDVVGDTTHDLAAMGKDAVHTASDYLGERARDLAEYVTPRVRDLAQNAADYLEPRARDLGQRGAQFASEKRETLQPKVAQFASDTRDNLQPKVAQFASDTRDNLQPRIARFASDRREQLQPYLEDARTRVQPHLEDAMSRVQPLVDTGRDRFEHDIRPRLDEAVANVNAMPQTKEARKRLAAATAALAGELALPEATSAPAKRSKAKTFMQVVIASGLLAGVVYAIRRFLAPEDSGWQAHEPSTAYRSREDYLAETADAQLDDDGAPIDEADADAESRPRRAAADDNADPFVVSPYGEGSYVGATPPADHPVKGNERSMKYHVPGSGGYDRTIADVWFTDEDAAEAAGFTKAQR